MVMPTPIVIGPQPRKVYPDHVQARKAVYEAKKAGKLTKGHYCESCGTLIDPLEGHHPDYSNPLEVKWLCRKCHNNKKRRFNKAKKINAFDYFMN